MPHLLWDCEASQVAVKQEGSDATAAGDVVVEREHSHVLQHLVADGPRFVLVFPVHGADAVYLRVQRPSQDGISDCWHVNGTVRQPEGVPPAARIVRDPMALRLWDLISRPGWRGMRFSTRDL
jgi:hypothetical protein